MLTSTATSCILNPEHLPRDPPGEQFNSISASPSSSHVVGGVDIRESSPGLAAGGSSSRICSQAPNGSADCS